MTQRHDSLLFVVQLISRYYVILIVLVVTKRQSQTFWLKFYTLAKMFSFIVQHCPEVIIIINNLGNILHENVFGGIEYDICNNIFFFNLYTPMPGIDILIGFS